MRATSGLARFGLIALLSLGLLSPAAVAQLGFEPPAPLNTNGGTDTGDDYNPVVATDGQGNWVAAWESTDTLGGTIGADYDILVSRSTDNGATWTTPAPLNSNAATDSGGDGAIVVATDGLGNWVAAWNSSDTLGGTIGSDNDILVSRSTDNGATWTAPAPLNANAATDSGTDIFPTVATDGQGDWVAAWESNDTLGGTIGADNDILVARSTNNGTTWTAPAPLNANAATDSGGDYSPNLATDREGNWVAAWQSNDTLGGTIGADNDILMARSTNNGLSWTAPAPLNSNAATDSGYDLSPVVAADGQGNWVAAWYSDDTLGGTIGADDDILVARSTNNGLTWTAPAPLNSNAATDSGGDFYPVVATDGEGNWVAVWYSNDTLGRTIGTDLDILVAHSTDNGLTWTAPAPLNANAATDSGNDGYPDVATDSQGNWVAVWYSGDTLGGTIGADLDILTARAIPPFVTLVLRADSNPTNASVVTFDVTFSEAVVGVDTADFAADAAGILSAAVTGVTAAKSAAGYSVTVSTGTGSGLIALTVLDNGTIKDLVGNKLGGLGNGAYVEGEVYTIDKSLPSVQMFSFAPNPTESTPIAVLAIFSEPVFGFSAGDVVAGNAAVEDFAGAGWLYTFNLNPLGGGLVTADLSAGIAMDAVGNANTAAPQFTRTFEAPTLTVTAPNGGEKLRRDKKFTIAWTSTGAVGPNVKIELFRNGGFVQDIKASTANDGSQKWKVPAALPVGPGYSIKITSTTVPASTDESDSTFRIKN